MTRLTTHFLGAGTRPAVPEFAYKRITMEDPATAAMTDFSRHKAITAVPNTTLSTATALMKSVGVRLLLVVNGEGGVEGVLSYRDIIGQKATAAAVRESVPHNKLVISEVMTALPNVEALDYSEVGKANVLELVTLMRERGRQHALVTETDKKGNVSVRGMFSITRIGRQLGIHIEAGERAQSFSEIEQLIAAA
jgi:CBS domain-containing protein